MQYGLALRSFDENEQALEKLRIAYDAFPESPHIEHALAQQRIIMVYQIDDEVVALAHFGEAESVLKRLHASNLDLFDRYPIITLSEGHIKLMVKLGRDQEARVLAKQYHDQIRKDRSLISNSRLNQTEQSLLKFYSTGIWPENADLEEIAT